ncbi:Gfo/Idh/MocA family protein [Phaeodactylibacter luteus]|uniref:Gfo/Idh/MocA family oxidoreductase n=1 Tax=Phaeodactylibacter luteus TaxID=1564516 RepID=A0A5C6S2Z0_9BACT|nr:Gfo/Idh/MocA family oxidoreductase [Phaeodactylibacter luteus]TXB68848.1 Gfo/Idh/MocA family oxidoreductase [Phaeodactylibacter luteus]
MSDKLNRRSFLQKSTLAGASLTGLPFAAIAASDAPLSKKEGDPLRVGIIGSGLRGQGHLDLLLRRKDSIVTAICDIDERMIARSLEIAQKHNAKAPEVYKGEYAYLELVQRPDIDAVLIATPWRWHTQQAVAAMQAGKYVGMEVSGAFSIDECWQLVNTHEATGTPLFFLENVCYRRDVMAVLQMVRAGLFGELVHLECGYQHDLRGVKFNDGETPYNSGAEFGEKAFSEARWRTRHSVHRNGDLYPTHGIGPVAQYINLNRGNRMTYLTSTATKSRGLHDYIVNHPKGGQNHPNAKVEFELGDIITTVVKTAKGESIIISHDTNLPRPYSLGFRVQGTKGLWMDLNDSIHLEGASPAHRWENAQPYLDRYDHPLWKKYASDAEGAGHGGMDWFLINDFVISAREGTRPPIDVYDAASWLAITPLSEQSIAGGSQPMAFPDFTRGRWMEWENTFAL